MVTRGQWSMVDLVFEVLRQTSGPAQISIWAWSITGGDGAPQEMLRQICSSPRITNGLLLWDAGPAGVEDTDKFTGPAGPWLARFGAGSVKNVDHHAKIVTLEVDGLRFVIRGSQNLLITPRIENIDVTEGGPEFDMVRAAELAYPIRRPAPKKRLRGELSRAPTVEARDARKAETFRAAAAAMGPRENWPGRKMLLTRGEFSFVDLAAVLLTGIGPAAIAVWTPLIAEYEVWRLTNMLGEGWLTAGRLFIHAESRSASIQQDIVSRIEEWRGDIDPEEDEAERFGFGPDSVRYVSAHAKMGTLENAEFKIFLRGSCNWNCCRKCEQIDVSIYGPEGGADFDLVRLVEASIPELDDDCTTGAAFRGSGLSEKILAPDHPAFAGIKKWQPKSAAEWKML